MKAPIAVGRLEAVYSGPFNKNVFRQKFKFPDGTVKDFYLWGSIENRPVVVFPMTRDFEVILVRQWRPGAAEHGMGGFVYELPGGHPKPGQDDLVAIVDELREETGYQARQIIRLPEFWLDPCSFGVSVCPFLAFDCEKVAEPKLDKTDLTEELIEQITIPISDWLNMLKTPEASDWPNTKDGKTLAITLLALLQLGFVQAPAM